MVGGARYVRKARVVGGKRGRGWWSDVKGWLGSAAKKVASNIKPSMVAGLIPGVPGVVTTGLKAVGLGRKRRRTGRGVLHRPFVADPIYGHSLMTSNNITGYVRGKTKLPPKEVRV